ncbi:MAG: prepilin-type N-terminal cleavage/methylation domain-containing protein [Sporosarcina sp.]
MKEQKLNRSMEENGFTLIEVLASIVILTLLLTTFLMMFLHSAKVNEASGHIIDAIYKAQTEMEKIYAASLSTAFSGREGAIVNLDYEKKVSEGSWKVFEKKDDQEDRLVKIRMLDRNVNMTRLIVEVYEGPDKILRAKMENILMWKADK